MQLWRIRQARLQRGDPVGLPATQQKIGRAAGEWIKEKLGGKGKVVELKGLMTSIPGQDRNNGFRDGIAGSGLEVIFEADMKWLEPDARKEMESALSRFPQIDLVYAHNDPGAHGAYLAAKAAGREKQIKFVGIDALPHEGVMYVKQGILDATFQYPTGGAEAIDASPIEVVLCTDTIERRPDALSSKIDVVSVAPLFAEAIRRIDRRESVSSLFQE